jgi:hypothetical protein
MNKRDLPSRAQSLLLVSRSGFSRELMLIVDTNFCSRLDGTLKFIPAYYHV